MTISLGTSTIVTWERGAAATGHTVTLDVIEPDGDSASPAVTGEAGTFSATIDATKPGRHLLTWTDADDQVVVTDTLEVWPADPRFLISFDDAVKALQWRPADVATNGDALRLYIASATEVIEDITGAILIRTLEQMADGGRTGVALWERPSEITSVHVYGEQITEFVVDLNAGIVWYDGLGGKFPPGRQAVKVVYKTGTEQVKPSIQLATRELVRHLWQVGQQMLEGTVDYSQKGPQLGRTPSGFAVPNRVIELCSNTYQLPGIA